MMLSLVRGTDFQGPLGLSGTRMAFVLMRWLSVGSFLGVDHQKDYARKGSLSLSPHPEG